MNRIIIYDFDGTLTPFPIPKFEFLEICGLKDGLRNRELNKKVITRSVEKNISKYDALYEEIFKYLKENNYELSDKTFSLGSDTVVYNPGLFEFFEYLINNNVDNYLLSSGIKVFLKNTKVAKYFKDIYASTFRYNGEEIVGLDYLMSDINKVEAIKDIMRKNNLVDCSNIIYVGDGLTDYYAMEFVINNNGTSIFVYNEKNNEHIEKMNDVISYCTKADYRLDKDLFKHIKEKCNI